ncbi:unnamed protein product [Tilletia controversa]|nr:unnamed protein product [Tilletia controversa]CAD6917811.1 unnamed protein product [Tilletia controversa]CAD6971276.1 unnamed protein product [Tilletia controversa]
MKLLAALQARWADHFFAFGDSAPPRSKSGTNNDDKAAPIAPTKPLLRSRSRAGRFSLKRASAAPSQPAQDRSEAVCSIAVASNRRRIIRSSISSPAIAAQADGTKSHQRKETVLKAQQSAWQLRSPHPCVSQPKEPHLVESPAQMIPTSASASSTAASSPVTTPAPSVTRASPCRSPLDTPPPSSPAPPPAIIGHNPLSKQFAESVSEMPSLYVGKGDRPLSLRMASDDGMSFETLSVVGKADVGMDPSLKPGSALPAEFMLPQRTLSRPPSACTLPELRTLAASNAQRTDFGVVRTTSVRSQELASSQRRSWTGVQFTTPAAHHFRPFVGDRNSLPTFARPMSPQLGFPLPHPPRPRLVEAPRSFTPPLSVIKENQVDPQRVKRWSATSVSSTGSRYQMAQPVLHRPIPVPVNGISLYQPMHLGPIPVTPVGQPYMPTPLNRKGSTSPPFPPMATGRAYPHDPRSPHNPYHPSMPRQSANIPAPAYTSPPMRPHMLPQVNLPMPSPFYPNMPAAGLPPNFTKSKAGMMQDQGWSPGPPSLPPSYLRAVGHAHSTSEMQGTYCYRTTAPFTLNGSTWGTGGFEQARQAKASRRRSEPSGMESDSSAGSSSKTATSNSGPVIQFLIRSPQKLGAMRLLGSSKPRTSSKGSSGLSPIKQGLAGSGSTSHSDGHAGDYGHIPVIYISSGEEAQQGGGYWEDPGRDRNRSPDLVRNMVSPRPSLGERRTTEGEVPITSSAVTKRWSVQQVSRDRSASAPWLPAVPSALRRVHHDGEERGTFSP